MTQNKTNMDDRTAKLHQIMDDNKLKARDVGEMLGRKPITVLIWRCKDDKRTIPQHALELLEHKLAARAAE